MTQLYVSDSTVAKMLGHTRSWLDSNAAMLERQYGFPKVDPAVGKRHAPSVERWAAERNGIGPTTGSKNSNQENLDAL